MILGSFLVTSLPLTLVIVKPAGRENTKLRAGVANIECRKHLLTIPGDAAKKNQDAPERVTPSCHKPCRALVGDPRPCSYTRRLVAVPCTDSQGEGSTL